MRLAYKWQAALIVALGLFMAILDNTIVSVTLPQMQRAFHTDFETITWVVTGYFLAHSRRPPPPGIPTVRAFQAAQGDIALTWLRERLGWS